MIGNQWLALTQKSIDIPYCIMPNHFHVILEITVGATLVVAQNGVTQNKMAQPQNGQPQGIAPTVGDILGTFKSIVANEYIRGVKNNHWHRFNGKLWQRNYWEHIIRNANEYQCIAQYIIDNPQKWSLDKLNDGAENQIMEPQSQYSVGAGPRACPNN